MLQGANNLHNKILKEILYTLFSSSLNNLMIIRSFNVKNDFIKTFRERIDVHTRANLTMKSAIHWFGVRIELISAPLALLVAILIFINPGKIRPSLLAFCLTMINRFQWGATQLAESRTLVISAQRIDEYAELPSEEDNGGEKGLILNPNGLYLSVSESGTNFSVGECQLICVARAVLRHSKILLIDEATANVDQTTDRVIQNVIRDKFNNRTILTIAHRLNTVDQSDRILVMEKGRVANFDVPNNIINYDLS